MGFHKALRALWKVRIHYHHPQGSLSLSSRQDSVAPLFKWHQPKFTTTINQPAKLRVHWKPLIAGFFNIGIVTSQGKGKLKPNLMGSVRIFQSFTYFMSSASATKSGSRKYFSFYIPQIIFLIFTTIFVCLFEYHGHAQNSSSIF